MKPRVTVTFLIMACAVLGIALHAASDEEVKQDQAQPQAQAPAASDDTAARDEAPEGAGELVTDVRTNDFVGEVTLAGQVSHIPPPLKIIVTDYVFNIQETIRGQPASGNITIRNEGGELDDQAGMESTRSVKLTTGNRYIVFARQVDGVYWLERALQIVQDGAVVGDENGRMIVGVQEGALITNQRRELIPLRYLPSVVTELPNRQGPPDQGTHRLENAAVEAIESAQPIALDAVKNALRAAAKGEEVRTQAPEKREAPMDPAPGAESDPSLRSITNGGYVSESVNFYTLLPNNDQWTWFQDCEGNWNRLVDNSPSGRNWLFGFMTQSNAPIRNEAPVANNNRFNCAVTDNTQMTNGGYQTWSALGANGVCYNWYTTTNGRIKESDVLINSSIAANEAQFRKSLTHEFGHALTLGHEDRYMALMYAGTWRQPPNYSSIWYSRMDDFFGARGMLRWVNGNIEANRWNLVNFADMATWSQAHATPGTSGNLVMTTISATTINRGSQVTLNNMHVENRGTTPVTNVSLKFYLSWNPTISNIDTEIASYTWSTFNPESYWTGNLSATVPSNMSTGTYYVGWVLTTPTTEISTSNNTTNLRRDSASNFAEQTVVVQ